MTEFTGNSAWRRLRLVILERDGYHCRIHGPKCTGRATEVDHIIPVADGGPIFDPANLRAACQPCNIWRANRQKAREGWRRSKTRVVLVVGPPAAGKTTWVADHAGTADLVVDYDAIAHSLGSDQHEVVMAARNAVLGKIRRGEVSAPTAYIISTNPQAEAMFPHHEVVTVDPGRGEVERRCTAERPLHMLAVVDDWYRRRSEARREW